MSAPAAGAPASHWRSCWASRSRCSRPPGRSADSWSARRPRCRRPARSSTPGRRTTAGARAAIDSRPRLHARSLHRRSRPSWCCRWSLREGRRSCGPAPRWTRKRWRRLRALWAARSRPPMRPHRAGVCSCCGSSRRLPSAFRAARGSRVRARLCRRPETDDEWSYASACAGTIVVSMNSRVYALANQKGGVGKTTTAINMAACVAEAGTPVLLIDLDPQANATTGLGFRPDQLELSTYDLLHGSALEDVVIETAVPNLFLAPSHPDLAAAQVELAAGDTLLRELLAGIGDQYPYVFVDCPPSLGLLTVNALSAANRLIVPVQCEYYALEGLAQLLQSVELVRTRLNPRLGVTGVLLTMYDARTHLARDVASEWREHFGPLVFDTVVPRSIRLAEAPSHGVPITRYDSRSAGADAYYRVALEVVERG